ncbi:MAG TPA: class I SAM-dependent methyltransferase [Candidatus Saccharimonadia bacterium]|nr:class I SAM-dependent methyltransferase [Candidatus Saccharimonadia bacterium]
MSYEAMTVGDPNPVKRYLHRRRYAQALDQMDLPEGEVEVLDFGAGSGELAHYLLDKNPKARVTLLEPAHKYGGELRDNVARHGSSVRVVDRFEDIEDSEFSHIFCLSVFEHLPEQELKEALERLHHVSLTETTTLVEVPNELFGAAIVKGIFRHRRRPSAFDGRVGNITRAVIGRPPADRPLSNFDPGAQIELPWHGSHLGFDHRALEQTIVGSNLFKVEGPTYAPINALGALMSLDVYYSLSRNT